MYTSIESLPRQKGESKKIWCIVAKVIFGVESRERENRAADSIRYNSVLAQNKCISDYYHQYKPVQCQLSPRYDTTHRTAIHKNFSGSLMGLYPAYHPTSMPSGLSKAQALTRKHLCFCI